MKFLFKINVGWSAGVLSRSSAMAGLAAFLGMRSDCLLQDFATAEFSDMFLICSFPVLSQSASLAGPVDGIWERAPMRKACIVESQGV